MIPALAIASSALAILSDDEEDLGDLYRKAVLAEDKEIFLRALTREERFGLHRDLMAKAIASKSLQEALDITETLTFLWPNSDRMKPIPLGGLEPKLVTVHSSNPHSKLFEVLGWIDSGEFEVVLYEYIFTDDFEEDDRFVVAYDSDAFVVKVMGWSTTNKKGKSQIFVQKRNPNSQDESRKKVVSILQETQQGAWALSRWENQRRGAGR